MLDIYTNNISQEKSATRSALDLLAFHCLNHGDLQRFTRSFLYTFKKDLAWIAQNDPAAKNSLNYVDECYRTALAIAHYRISNLFYLNNQKTVAWSIATNTYKLTRVFIHPSAEIGIELSIDHGTDTLIGSDVKIGAKCIILNDVQIGWQFDETTNNTEKKTIIIGDEVTICARTRIQKNSEILSNSFLKPGTNIDSNQIYSGHSLKTYKSTGYSKLVNRQDCYA